MQSGCPHSHVLSSSSGYIPCYHAHFWQQKRAVSPPPLCERWRKDGHCPIPLQAGNSLQHAKISSWCRHTIAHAVTSPFSAAGCTVGGGWGCVRVGIPAGGPSSQSFKTSSRQLGPSLTGWLVLHDAKTEALMSRAGVFMMLFSSPPPSNPSCSG